MYGMLDRIEDGKLAVILIDEKNKEVIIPIEQLPPNSEVGTWFQMKESDDSFQVLSIDPDKTEQEAAKSTALLEKLRARRKDSQYKTDQ